MKPSSACSLVSVAIAFVWLLGAAGAWTIVSVGIARAASQASCPASANTLVEIERVPEAERATCFGRRELTFVARGGTAFTTFPGVTVDASFGEPWWFADRTLPAGFIGWKRPDLPVPSDAPSQDADGGGGENVWWRVSGHFDDQAAARCRPDDGASTVDGRPVVFTDAQAVALCRGQFMIDGLAWLPVPRTDTLVPESRPSDAWRTIAGLGSAIVGLCLYTSWSRRRRMGGRP